jgi:hypothetical protein
MVMTADTPCVPTRKVSSATRSTLAAVCALAAWQIAWIAEQADRLDGVIPPPWSVAFWLAAWTLVLATSAVAAITGHDRCTRAALGVLAVVQVMGIATSIADGVPMGRQFWQVGSAGLICGWCAAMLASPLRSVPTREWTPHA